MSKVVNGVVLLNVTVQYLETVLWAETVSLPVPEEVLVNGCMDVDEDHPLHGVSESSPLDDHFDINDFTIESLEGAERDCTEFFDRANTDGLIERARLIKRARRFIDDAYIAHDFWLTRQGHGAGFWDGDYRNDTDDVGSPLSKLTEEFGECNVFVDEDGCLHLES